MAEARNGHMRGILIALGVVIVLLLGAVAGYFYVNSRYVPAYRMDEVQLADFAKTPVGKVWIAGFNAQGARDLLTGGRTAAAEPVMGTLILPPDASASNPVPAFVILQGSSGDFSRRAADLASKLAAVGIAGFAVDSLGSRKLKVKDNYLARLQKASIYTQIADGYNALKALQQHPFIRKDRIGVAGFSLGGSAALLSAFEQISEPMTGKAGPRFAAHVMFYPGCNLDFEDFRLDGSPWLIMIGRRDESISPRDCRTLIRKAQALGVHTTFRVYEDAGHAWNAPEPAQYVADALVTRGCMTEWTRDGSVVEKTTGYSYDNPLTLLLALRKCATRGYAIGRNDAANRQSVRDLVDFLDAEWGGRWSARLNDEILSIGIPRVPEQALPEIDKSTLH
jgi:dienelactone hydrolase